KDGKWGLLNTKNKKLIGPEYLELYPLDDHSLICSRKYFGDVTPQYGLINTKGKLLIEFKYDHLDKNHGKLIARIRERNSTFYGLLDDNGKVLIPFKYKRIVALNPRLYAASTDLYNYLILNEEGVSLNTERYDSIGTFNGGYARIFKNGRQGLVDENGKIVVAPDFEAIKVNADGKIMVQPFPRWTLIDDRNQVRGSFDYENLIPFEKQVFKAAIGESQALINI